MTTPGTSVTLVAILTTSKEGRTYTPVRIFAKAEDANRFTHENSPKDVFERELTPNDIRDRAALLTDQWFTAQVPFSA